MYVINKGLFRVTHPKEILRSED